MRAWGGGGIERTPVPTWVWQDGIRLQFHFTGICAVDWSSRPGTLLFGLRGCLHPDNKVE